MIILKNVSMKFNLGVEKDNSLKMIFINLFTPKKKKKKDKRYRVSISQCETSDWEI